MMNYEQFKAAYLKEYHATQWWGRLECPTNMMERMMEEAGILGTELGKTLACDLCLIVDTNPERVCGFITDEQYAEAKRTNATHAFPHKWWEK